MILIDAVKQSTTLTLEQLVNEWVSAMEHLEPDLTHLFLPVTEACLLIHEHVPACDIAASVHQVVHRETVLEWCESVAELIQGVLVHTESDIVDQYVTAYLMKVRDFQHALML